MIEGMLQTANYRMSRGGSGGAGDNPYYDDGSVDMNNPYVAVQDAEAIAADKSYGYMPNDYYYTGIWVARLRDSIRFDFEFIASLFSYIFSSYCV